MTYSESTRHCGSSSVFKSVASGSEFRQRKLSPIAFGVVFAFDQPIGNSLNKTIQNERLWDIRFQPIQDRNWPNSTLRASNRDGLTKTLQFQESHSDPKHCGRGPNEWARFRRRWSHSTDLSKITQLTTGFTRLTKTIGISVFNRPVNMSAKMARFKLFTLANDAEMTSAASTPRVFPDMTWKQRIEVNGTHPYQHIQASDIVNHVCNHPT